MTDTFARIVEKIYPDNKLLRAWPLVGGISAQVTALEIARPDGQTQRMIVRQHGPDDVSANPNVATDEFKLLSLLQSAGIAAPTPYYADQSGDILPTPYIVVEYIDGQTEFTPADLDGTLMQMAAHLAHIHSVSGDFSFLRQAETMWTHSLANRPAQVDDSLSEGRIRDLLEQVWPPPQRNPLGLLHGDYWPGNILWKNGRLVAVIDWEDAKVGDPLLDLANVRMEIAWTWGIDAVQRFTQHYQALTNLDYTNLPYWELAIALRPAFKMAEWATDLITEQRMRDGHRWYVTQAFEKLPL